MNMLRRAGNRLPIRFIYPYLTAKPLPLQGQVKIEQFTDSKGGEQRYIIYLPQGYEQEDRHYPTLFHLHGAKVTEAWVKLDCNHIAAKLEEAISAGICEPMIIVAASDPFGDSMWSDGHDGRFQISSAFTQELIPHIDATYRTIAKRSHRAIQGFSMGGFGAAMTAFKYPDLFCAVLGWDGALHTWQTLTEEHQSIAKKIFGTEAYFNEWSPWRLSKQQKDSDLDIRIIAGEHTDFCERYRDHLKSLGWDVSYTNSGCGHNLFCMLNKSGLETFTFLANSFLKARTDETSTIAT